MAAIMKRYEWLQTQFRFLTKQTLRNIAEQTLFIPYTFGDTSSGQGNHERNWEDKK